MKLKKFNFKIINSTNDRAFQIIKKTNNKSGIVIAEKQKRGRGQYGKKWTSFKGNLFVSIFFQVNMVQLSLYNLTKINCLLVKKLLSNFYKGKITIKLNEDLKKAIWKAWKSLPRYFASDAMPVNAKTDMKSQKAPCKLFDNPEINSENFFSIKILP